jgi:glycine dehydrogenase subunit 2
MLEEALIFEIGDSSTTGVDFAPAPKVTSRLGGLDRHTPLGLPGLSEPETVRHYTRLSRQNYAIDLGLFPLGSCTMKHNPRLNEKVARMKGFQMSTRFSPRKRCKARSLLFRNWRCG